MTEHDDALARAPQTLGELADLVGTAGHTANQRRSDRLVAAWLADRRVLAGTPEGRAAIAALMDDERPAVRLWSAAAVLGWDPDAARPVPVAIRDFPLDYDLHSISAKQTLLAFDAGTLDPDAHLPGT